MSLSFTEVEYLGGPQVFPTNFALGILEVDHIEVTSLTEVDGLGDPLVYEFSYNASNADVTVIDTLSINERIKIARVVPKEELYVNFETSDITPRNVDNTVKQALMAVHEVVDQEEANRAIAQSASDKVDAFEDEAEDILEAAATSASTASTQAGIATTQAGLALTRANASEVSRQAAETAATNSGNSATASQASRLAAEAARNTAITEADDAAASATASQTARLASESARDVAIDNANATDADAIQTAADRVQTGLDRVATGEDRIQTGLDRDAAAQSALDAAVFDPALYVTKLNPVLNGTVTGTVLADQATMEAGTVDDELATPLGVAQAIDAQVPDLFNATGSAPLYACRAWVKFIGTDTVTIVSSGNVSSITDHGTGMYTINFATDMPDADYCYVFGASNNNTNALPGLWHNTAETRTVSAFRIRATTSNTGFFGLIDPGLACVSIFR